MYEKVMNVFYGTDLLPYKDKERQVHFPITGNAFLGASNTTQIRFFIDQIGNYTDTWVANSKLPNGKLGNKVLSSSYDSEIGEHYVYLDLSSYYTQAKGDLYISLNGFVGGITITESGGQYSIQGIPTIQATGVIKIAINYATPLIDGDEVETITLQQLLAIMGSKLPKNDNKYLKIVDSATNLNTQTYKDYIFANDIVYFVDSGEFAKISGTYPNLTRNNITIYAYNVNGAYGDFEVLKTAVSFEVPSFGAIKDEDNVSLQTWLTNNYVDLTSDQTIGGKKTFNDETLFSDKVVFDEDVDFESTVQFADTIIGGLIPEATNSYNIGTPSNRWKDLYLGGDIDFNGVLKSGNTSMALVDIATKNYVSSVVQTIRRGQFQLVDLQDYPTLQDFLDNFEDYEEGIIYLYPINTSDPNEGYYEYTHEDDIGWVLLGTTNINLGNYYTIAQTDNLLSYKADKSDTYTKNEVDSLLDDTQDLMKDITSEALDVFTVKKNCPWLKEIYINEVGKARDISAIWNVFANPTLNTPWLGIANSAENAITGYVINIDNKKNKMLPIVDAATYNVVLGYVVIDWNLYPTADADPTTQLLDYAYNKDYSPSIKEYVNNIETKLKEINALINGGDKATELYTFNLPDSVSGNTSYIWFPVYKWVRKINKISYLSNTGVVNFYKVKISNGTATSTLIASATNTSDEGFKIKSIYVDVELEDDEYIGINGSFFYDGVERNYKCSNVTVSDGSVANPSAQTMFFNCEYDKNFGSKIESLEKYSNNKGRCVLYNAKLTSENSDLVLGTQTFDSYGLVVNPTTGGFRLNKYYAIEERTVTYVAKFSSDCNAQFVSFEAFSTNETSTFIIDVPTKNTGLYQGGLPTVRCGLLANYTHEFAISITKDYMNYIVEIRDLNNGAYWKQTFTRNGQGGAGEGAIGTLINVPMQWDMYGFKVINGSMSISQIIITAPKCDILLYGDSITEPEAYYPLNQFPYSWTQLLRKVAGRKKVVTSGRGGTALTQIQQRIQNELPFVKPKYCMITIGTNGGYTVQEMTTLIQYIKSLGIIPILNHIPCYNNNGDTTGFISVNAVIDQVRQSENIKGADLDKATSINNDGQTLDETVMWLETYSDNSIYRHHPNMKGSERIIARILIDIPEVFD